MTSQLILVAIRGKHTQIVFGPATPQIISTKKSELIRSGNWSGWKFQLRTSAGYKNVKILTKKNKTND